MRENPQPRCVLRRSSKPFFFYSLEMDRGAAQSFFGGNKTAARWNLLLQLNMQRKCQQGGALTNQESCLIKRFDWADEWIWNQTRNLCQGLWTPLVDKNISTFIAASTLLFLFDRGSIYDFSHKGFVSVVNVLLAVCSALSHTNLSVQVCLRRTEGATKPD